MASVLSKIPLPEGILGAFSANLSRGVLGAISASLPQGASDFVYAYTPPIALAFVLLLTFFLLKRLAAGLLRGLARKYGDEKRVVIVGNCAEAARGFVREAAHGAGLRITVLGAVGDCAARELGCEKLGEMGELEKILDLQRPDFAVFAIDSYEKSEIISLVNLCDDRCVKVYFLPVIYGYFRSARQVEHLGSTPLINVHSTPLDIPSNAFIKRAVDIVGALLLIILTSPIMLAAAVGVKISSEGPVLFRQVRVGRMGQEFVMLKFRSMRLDPKGDCSWSTGVDERKTRFGNFLRRTSIDELPQLFNVLAGSMSLVGPRPEIPRFVEQFRNEIPLYMVKHYVKPGITGLAQVNGLRGDTSIRDRIYADIYYIETWSLMLDLSVLLRTPFKAINKSEVYTGDGCGRE